MSSPARIGTAAESEISVLAASARRLHRYLTDSVPVDWVEDPDSRVAIVATALADLRGVARLARERIPPTNPHLTEGVTAA